MNGNNQYLVPANTKKGGLIFNMFTSIDLWILGIGIGISLGTLLLMSLFNFMDSVSSILAIIPGIVAGALVFPVPNYHNVRTAIGEVIAFYTNRQRYVWRGWCSSYEFKGK